MTVTTDRLKHEIDVCQVCQDNHYINLLLATTKKYAIFYHTAIEVAIDQLQRHLKHAPLVGRTPYVEGYPYDRHH